MKVLNQNIKYLVIIGLILLFVVNYSILVLGFSSDFFGIVFSVLLFFIGGRKTTLKVNYLLIGLIVILEFISFRLHTKSLHFLALMLFACLVYYEFTKKFSFIALLCILLFSTVFSKFFEHMTTEIKQSLCENVYVVLNNFINIDRIEGVNFYINGAKISIDTACMGLAMFKTGLLIGAILLTLEERKQKLYFSVFQIVSFSIAVVVLNIISNYFRIITLILLNCTEENTLHHTIGLTCFIIYQVIPMLLLIRFLKPKSVEMNVIKSQRSLVLILSAFLIMVVTSIEMKSDLNYDLLVNLDSKYDIKKGVWVDNEVFKIETYDKLIYIKTPSHKPLICWTGTGYKITESREVVIENELIWFNKMEKDNVNYQSLWWYECDGKKYTSFIEVMLIRLIYPKPIRLINETSIIK
ncbi:exosortase N [Flavobacterium sp. SM2513]|uniref:exosortase N n=1 Tax=Flavobacterium sp. SM2513 TaxID=3424766 RepID=UPI003D7F3CF3